MGFCYGQKVHIMTTDPKPIPKDVRDGHLEGDLLYFDIEILMDGRQVLLCKNVTTNESFHVSTGKHHYWKTADKIEDPRFGVLWTLKNEENECTPYIPEKWLCSVYEPNLSIEDRLLSDIRTIINQTVDKVELDLIEKSSLDVDKIEEVMSIIRACFGCSLALNPNEGTRSD